MLAQPNFLKLKQFSRYLLNLKFSKIYKLVLILHQLNKDRLEDRKIVQSNFSILQPIFNNFFSALGSPSILLQKLRSIQCRCSRELLPYLLGPRVGYPSLIFNNILSGWIPKNTIVTIVSKAMNLASSKSRSCTSEVGLRSLLPPRLSRLLELPLPESLQLFSVSSSSSSFPLCAMSGLPNVSDYYRECVSIFCNPEPSDLPPSDTPPAFYFFFHDQLEKMILFSAQDVVKVYTDMKGDVLPRTLKRNSNDLTLSWSELFNNDVNISNSTFRLEISDETKDWKAIYCGPKTELRVDGLAPCTCYEFRLKANEQDWIRFKAATEDLGPYTFVMHMTRAIKLGKTAVIRKIASLRPDLLNVENKDHKTPILQAIDVKDLQVLQLFITLGANVNKPLLHSKRTPLMYAVYKGELEAASFLLEKGANIFNTDINGLNIIHHAVDSNTLSNVQFALHTGLSVNTQDNNGWTPLLRAVVLKCRPEIVEYLLAHGADVNIKDNLGFDIKKHQYLNRHFCTS